MIKLFDRIFWHNNTTPAINEDNLNAMSKAIDDIDDRVIELGADVLEAVPQIQAYLDQAEDLVDAMEQLSKNPPYIGANGNWYVWDTNTDSYADSGVDASITVQIADVTMLAYGTAPYITNTGTDTDPIFHLFIPRAAGISSITKTGTSGLVDTYTVTFQDGNTSTFNVTNGKGIVSIAKTSTSGLVDTYTVTFNDSTTTTFDVTNGENGQDGEDGTDGRGIVSITKTGTSGLVDTYTITYSDNTTSTFTVTNGKDGIDGVSPTVTISAITGGHTVSITDKDHPTGQSFNVMDGTGAGDMLSSIYDPQGTVASAGGIPAYAAKKPTLLTQTLAANATSVTFTSIPTTGNNLIDFYIDGGANYTAINTATAGQITLTYDATSSARTVYCEIKEVS